MMSTFGFVTIGQSPRTDIVSSMLPESSPDSVCETGALDLLGRDEISRLQPDTGDDSLLVTRLRDGTEVTVSKTRLLPYLHAAIKRTVARGVNGVLVLCTGEFPALDASVPVLYPDRVLKSAVDALLPTGTLGVVMPHPDQAITMREKWETPNRRFIGAAVSPYSEPDMLTAARRSLEEQGTDLILLDCMGFTAEMKTEMAQSARVPVILANRLVGQIIEEMITGRG